MLWKDSIVFIPKTCLNLQSDLAFLLLYILVRTAMKMKIRGIEKSGKKEAKGLRDLFSILRFGYKTFKQTFSGSMYPCLEMIGKLMGTARFRRAAFTALLVAVVFSYARAGEPITGLTNHI